MVNNEQKNKIMQDLIYGLLRNRQKRFEGFRTKVYWDSTGNLTVGWGHNITICGFPEKMMTKYKDMIRVISRPLTNKMCEELLTCDLENAVIDLSKFFGWSEFSEFGLNRQEAMKDMVFNMGIIKFSKFKKMVEAIRVEDWREAGHQIENSKYYDDCTKVVNKLREQGITNTFHRAGENMQLIIEG